MFHSLANIPSDMNTINKCLNTRRVSGRLQRTSELMKEVETEDEPTELEDNEDEEEDVVIKEKPRVELDEDQKSEIIEESMEGSHPALPAEPGTLKATLLETPCIGQMTEKESAHPTPQLLDKIAASEPSSVITDITNGEADLNIVTEPSPVKSPSPFKRAIHTRGSIRVTQNPSSSGSIWRPNPEWVQSWRAKLPLQTIMRLLQVLVPQVEKICIDK